MGQYKITKHIMKSFCLLAAVLVSSSSAASLDLASPRLTELEYGYSSGSPQPADITATLTPFPVHLVTGEVITLFLSINQKEAIPVLMLGRESWLDPVTTTWT